tara:strand:+ start:3083 stop:3301 length:219 start_codon:yes stop_codon:yes gene_type:complete
MIPYGGTFKFSGPSGATNQQFFKANSDCYAKVQPAVGPPQCGALMVCMAGKGYTQDPNGRFDGKPVAVRCEL